MTTDQLYDPKLETMPWDDVQKMTFEAAREQLERVYARSPFYRRRFDEAGVTPSDVRQPEDLVRIPLMDKEQERQSQDDDPPFGEHLCADRDDVVRIYASSGTTGRPTFFALTQRDLDNQTTVMARVFHTAGIRKSDTMG
ncbi:MAG: phenylacetate--CoA ligase family protein, partial [Actinophytocola sp.]|nr:phenylacetate--CoA ligase family protein [Actinophytocola sp.]